MKNKTLKVTPILLCFEDLKVKLLQFKVNHNQDNLQEGTHLVMFVNTLAGTQYTDNTDLMSLLQERVYYLHPI